jgi:hypothetical protein
MNRIVAAVVLGVVVTAATVSGPPAHALVVPPATSLAECATAIGNIDNPTFCQTDTDLAQVTLAPFAGAQAQAIYPGSFDVANAGAIASLSYSWAFEGGNPGDLLPVDISVNLGVSSFGSNNALGFASMTVSTPLQGNVQVCVSTNGQCRFGSNGFEGVISVVARSGDVNTIVIEAEASGVFSADVNGGSAFADPHIFLDPQFAQKADYQLRLSDGVSNALGPVPEPGTAAMMGVGLAGVAGALTRRRAARLWSAASEIGP